MRWQCRLKDGQRYCRRSTWPHTVGSHSPCRQAVKRLKFATALLMCSCSSSFQMICKTTFNSWVVLGFCWDYFTFPAWHTADVIVQWVQMCRVSMNHAQRDRLQQLLHDARNAEKLRVFFVEKHNFAIFGCILTKRRNTVYILLFDSYVKFHAKICMHRRNINKSQELTFYWTTLYVCVWSTVGKAPVTRVLCPPWSGTWPDLKHISQ